jgi:predicted oxidoreductase (fatty acid repression mutant protein)
MSPNTPLQAFFSPIKTRISCYSLTNTSPIPDARIQFIVEFAVKHAPSAFNVQSARAVILLKADHEKLWGIADKALKASMPEGAYQALAPRVQGFRAGYGSVLWFEDQDALDTLKEKNPAIQASISECRLPLHRIIVCLPSHNANPMF